MLWLARTLRLTTPHFQPVLWSNLVPWLTISGYRAVVASHTSSKPRVAELLALQAGELQFWSGWIAAWIVGLSLLDPGDVGAGRARAARWLRGVMHVLAIVVLVGSLLDLQFFDVTGSRGDWDALGVLAADFRRVWPVVSSEFRPKHAALLAVIAALGVGPMFWQPRSAASRARLAAWALLVPSLVFQVTGRPRVGNALRTLVASLPEHLLTDGLDRLGERQIAPAPPELVPIEVRPGDRYKPFNIVVVFLESVSAIRTTPYAPELPTTPNLDALASDGAAIRNFFTVVPHTSKALVASLCGHWPRLSTEVREARPGGLPDRCLPELLGSLGYRTAFFQTADEEFEDRYRLVHQLGFGHYRAKDSLPSGFEKNNYFGFEERAMLKPGLAWSARRDDRPFLAVYLTLTSHHDYKVPKHWKRGSYPGRKAKEQEQLDAIRYVDDFVGKLVDGYREKGLADNTLFVVLGDHGEAFGEHGRSQHDLVVWDEGMAVPGVFWGAPLDGRAGWVEGEWQQIDLVPTLFGLLGVDVVKGALPGADMFGPAPDRALFHSCWRSHRCLARRQGGIKSIDHYRERGPQRFDLTSDPSETRDLWPELPSATRDAEIASMRDWRARVQGLYSARTEGFLANVAKPDERPATHTWGDRIDAVACALESPEVVVGSSLWARCTWRARAHLEEAVQVRTRLVLSEPDKGERLVEAEWFPLDGVLPTWRWQPGHGVPDALRLKVPSDTRAARAKVQVAWFGLGGGSIDDTSQGDWLTIGEVRLVPR